MLDASSGYALLSKSYEEGYNLIERITSNTYKWPVTRTYKAIIPNNPVSVHEVTETIILDAQVA